MNYMGGKHRQGPIIAKAIREVLGDRWYVEPFCGALGVASRVAHNKMVLGDISAPLVNMWDAFRDPLLELPDTVTEDEYLRVKAIKDPNDWRTAYYGFGMSFGSKYWGGYAREAKGTGHATNLKRSTNLKISTDLKRSKTRDAKFVVSNYSDLEMPVGSVVYCDPPYRGRTTPFGSSGFDHNAFWDWSRLLVSAGHVVLVTEFLIPDDFVVLYDFGDTVVRHHSAKPADGTREVLACHESQSILFDGFPF